MNTKYKFDIHTYGFTQSDQFHATGVAYNKETLLAIIGMSHHALDLMKFLSDLDKTGHYLHRYSARAGDSTVYVIQIGTSKWNADEILNREA